MDTCSNSRANTCEKLRLTLSGVGRSVFIRLKTNALSGAPVGES